MQRHLQKYRIRKLWPLETETFRLRSEVVYVDRVQGFAVRFVPQREQFGFAVHVGGQRG